MLIKKDEESGRKRGRCSALHALYMIGNHEFKLTRTSGPLYLLAEHSKLHRKTVSDRTGSGVIYDRPVTLITDSGADPAICESLRKKGIEVVLAEISYTEM